MPKKASKTQRIKIGKSIFVPILMKVISTNEDGSPRWLEVARDDEMMDLQHGSRQFYLVWGSELLAGRVGQGPARASDLSDKSANGPAPELDVPDAKERPDG